MKRRNFVAITAATVVAAPLTVSTFLSPNLEENFATKKRKNMKVLIMGASGMVGSEVLKLCLEAEEIEEITIIVRRDLKISHPKLKQIIHQNFNDFSTLNFGGFDICFYCIGAYSGKLPDDEYINIIYTIPKNFANQLKEQNKDITVCYLTGMGSDENSKTLYAREFGKIENHLKNLNFARLHIFRPAYIYPSTPRKEPHFGYLLMRLAYKPILSHFKTMSITSNYLASVMLNAALSEEKRVVFENVDMIKYGGN